MTSLLRGLLCAALLALAPSLALAQTAGINGPYLTGAAPSGFGTQAFQFNCNNATPTSGQCWPYVQLYDGTNVGTINSGDGGLLAHITNTLTVSQPAVTTNGSTIPASSAAMGASASGNMAIVPMGTTTVPINISTATTTQLVALASGKAIYVTGWDVIAGGTGNITLEYGTGSNCGTGTTALTGAYPLVANAGIARGVGFGPVLVIPIGDALCAVTSAAVQMSGSLTYSQY